MAQQPLVSQGLLTIEGFTITLRHTTLGRTPLDEGSARRRDLYVTTHNTYDKETYMLTGWFRTRNPSKRAAADPRLRPRGHWDRPVNCYCIQVKEDEIYVECSLYAEFWLRSLKIKITWKN